MVAADRPLKIGEAARLLGVEAYVLRFWETQFAFLRPKHSRSRHRYYGPVEIQTLRLIKRLLHHEGYTIAGARKHIRETGLDHLLVPAKPSLEKNDRKEPPAKENDQAPVGFNRALLEIREDLRSLRKLLNN
jgi:DNA-binding transcriptional MerR regulator